MNKLDEMSMNIEHLRQEMHNMVEKEKDLLSYKVINISQKLDKLIIEYDRLKSK